jgi:tetratricopeptide (TPR) repeat protein
MASNARIDELKKKFDENPRRYFAPLANEFRKMGDLDQAVMICEEFLPQQPGHMSGHIVYGQALYETGKLAESRTVFETALGLDPENLIALRHLGDISRSQGQLEEARRWYDRVLEADPRNEEIQGLIGLLSEPGAAAPIATAGAGDLEGAEAPAALTPPPPTMAPAHPAIPSLPPEPKPAPRPELMPIDLDMDEMVVGPKSAVEQAPASPPPSDVPAPAPLAPSRDSSTELLAMDGLELTSDSSNRPAIAPTAGLETSEFQAPSPAAAPARADGLLSAEFEVPTSPPPRAEGLEPAEFEAPSAAPPRALGLETTEFEPPPSSTSLTSSLPDLEGSFGMPIEESTPAASTASPAGPDTTAPRQSLGFPSLDLEGDAAAMPSPAAATPAPDPFGAGLAAAGAEAGNPRMEPPAAMEAMPALAPDDATDEFSGRRAGETAAERQTAALAGLPMMELPPSVIAAEAQLIDQGAMLESTATSIAEESRGPGAPFVTETMAELYLKQGFRDQALLVYRQLSMATPGDERLRAKVAELEPVPEQATSGPTVREFLARFAARRPGEHAAESMPPAHADFAAFDAVPASPTPVAMAPVPTPTEAAAEPAAVASPAPMASAAERGATAQGGSPAAGPIDALFGNRAVGRSEDSAASALAQAFSGSTATSPAISGRPARAASAELSLDSVFGGGGRRTPRATQSFSFDQFFSESAATEGQSGAPPAAAEPASPGAPAERGADDIQQFNSWLQGLKQR